MGQIGVGTVNSEGRKSNIPWEVLGENDEVITDRETILDKWKTDFATLYNPEGVLRGEDPRPPAHMQGTANIDTGLNDNISMVEIRAALVKA